MNKKDSQRYDSDILVENFMDEHNTELITINTYSPLKIAFLAGMSKMKTALELQAEDITVWAAEKAMLWDVMANSLFKYSNRASVQAFTLNLFDLELSLDKPITYFTACDDLKALERATEQKDIMKNNNMALTEITAGNITEMETNIKAFEKIRMKPKEKRHNRSAEGFDPTHGLLNDIDIPKNRIGKLVYSYLPDLIGDWDKAAKVGQPEGTHHTSIAILYTGADTGVHLKNVKCTLTNGVKSIIKKSTAKGWVHFYSLGGGEWTITSELAGYDNDVQTKIGTEQNLLVKLDVKLKKKAVAEQGTPVPDPETTTGTLDLFAFIKTTGEPLAGAQYVINGTPRVGTTDEEGEGYEDMLAPGDYTGTLFMEGYKDLSFTFTIVAGEVATVSLKVEVAV